MDDRTRRYLQHLARQIKAARDAERGVREVNDLIRAQPCAMQFKSRCQGGESVQLFWPEDERVTVPAPACATCASILEDMLKRPGQRQEAEHRLLEAIAVLVSALVDSHYLKTRRRDFGAPRFRLSEHDQKA